MSLNTFQAADLDAVVGALQRMRRRDFLRLAGATTVSCLTAGVHATPTPVLKFMSSHEAAVFARLAQVVLPVDGTALTPWQPEGLLQTLDAALLGTMEPHLLAGLKGGVEYFDAGPLTLHGSRFTTLDDTAATQFCNAWGDSDLPAQRGLAMGLKKLVQLSYWANPAAWPPLEYDGPLTQRLDIPRLGNAPMPTR